MRPSRGRISFAIALLVVGSSISHHTVSAEESANVAEDDASRSVVTSTTAPSVNRTTAIVAAGLGTAALVSALAGGSDRVSRWVDGSPLDGPIDVADRYGDGSVLGLTALGLMGAGRLANDARLTDTGDHLASSLVTAWTATWLLKLTIDVDRPSGGSYSFPSGHTATAFAAAPVVHRHMGPVAGYAAYGVATLTGLARLEDHKHHLGDVFAGAAIGILAGHLTKDGLPLRWNVKAEGRGMGLEYRF